MQAEAGARHEEWMVEGPRVLDIGGEGERVTALRVAVVGGRVDVVTHDDSPTARVEVTQVEGLPVKVRWDGATLTVSHGKDADTSVLELLRRTVESFGRHKVVLSLSVPPGTDTMVSTVSATALVSGLRARVRANTVSGALALSDLEGDLDLNTVSGDVECTDVNGPLKINAVSGEVTVLSGTVPTAKVNTVSGDIALDLTGGRCTISSNSVSGDVTVRAPLEGFDGEGNTASGQVVVDGTRLSYGGEHGPKHGGRLSRGDGALKVRANAVSGSIVVLRTAAAAPPQDADVPLHPEPPHDAGRPSDAGHPQDHPDGWTAPEVGDER